MNGDGVDLQEIRDELFFSQKRYEIAIGSLTDSIFDYVIDKKQVINHPGSVLKFGLEDVISDVPEVFIRAGMIQQGSIERFRRLYQRIDDGEKISKEVIIIVGKDGKERPTEITMTNLFDAKNKPVRAIGVMKNIADTLELSRENAYKETFAASRVMCSEANITINKVISYDEDFHYGEEDFNVNDRADMLKRIAEKTIAPEHRTLFLAKSSRQNILSAFERGQDVIEFQYLRKVDEGYQWMEKTMHIIQDPLTGDIYVRSYVKNIHGQKEKERRVKEEQQFHTAMAAKSHSIYEVNIIKNLIISGHEHWDSLFGIKPIHNYEKMIELLCKKAIHPEDRESFLALYLRTNVVNAYADGLWERICEYRCLGPEGQFVWVRGTMRLFEDILSDDIKAYIYIQNVDEEKKVQLAIAYNAEHDSLTGLYNKGTAEQKVLDFLATSDAKVKSHAFFILDFDNFKLVNDHFGHVFGDAFLSQAAAKIKSLLHEEDVIGRIGGDEFVIFMKNIRNEKSIEKKAAQLCSALMETYTENGAAFSVTVSIGIALYSTHGNTYQELYANSDTALYYAKEHGRNQFVVYREGMHFGGTSVKKIDSAGILQAKIFEENISEYVFRMLYEAQNKYVAINSVLELIGRHYGVSRICIFENAPDGLSATNTFKWIKDKTVYWDKNSVVAYEKGKAYEEHFNKDGYFFVSEEEEEDGWLKEILKQKHICSMWQLSIEKDKKFVGFISFERCDAICIPTQKELSECRNMANVLGIFLTKMRALEDATASKATLLSVVNALGSCAYVCDPVTFRLLFVNQTTRELAPEAKEGDFCYQSIRQHDSVCGGCPLTELIQSGKEKITREQYDEVLDRWFRVTISWVRWLDDQKACLVDCVDITEYRRLIK